MTVAVGEAWGPALQGPLIFSPLPPRKPTMPGTHKFSSDHRTALGGGQLTPPPSPGTGTQALERLHLNSGRKEKGGRGMRLLYRMTQQDRTRWETDFLISIEAGHGARAAPWSPPMPGNQEPSVHVLSSGSPPAWARATDLVLAGLRSRKYCRMFWMIQSWTFSDASRPQHFLPLLLLQGDLPAISEPLGVPLHPRITSPPSSS